MTWQWQRAGGADVPDIVAMAQRDFQSEIVGIFEPDPVAYARNCTQAIVNQFYGPNAELFMVARHTHSQQLLAYVWVIRNQRAPWSDDEMACVRMVHLDLSLPQRSRLRLVQQMIGLWEVWATEAGVPVVCSTTMRRDVDTFMRVHAALGYDTRGSYAYKRLF